MDKFPKVAIIILNWNGLKDTIECLESVFRIDYQNFEVIVVDNGSIDNSGESIRKLFPQVIIIENGKNLGFAEGNNVGIRHAQKNQADYIWLLNNDVVVDRNALSSMVEFGEKESRIGILGSKIYYYDDPELISFAGATINWKKATSPHIGRGEKDIGQYEYYREVERVNGCSMLVKKEVLENVGLLDEKYFLYVEEVDWCVRAKKKGYNVYYVPSSKVYHKISMSMGENSTHMFAYYNTRNFLYLIRKIFHFPKREIYLTSAILWKIIQCKGLILKLVIPKIFLKTKNNFEDIAPLLGIFHFFIGKMGKGRYENLL